MLTGGQKYLSNDSRLGMLFASGRAGGGLTPYTQPLRGMGIAPALTKCIHMYTAEVLMDELVSRGEQPDGHDTGRESKEEDS